MVSTRRALAVAGVALIAAAAAWGGLRHRPEAGSAARSGAPAARPSVILVTIDTLRADRVGGTGRLAGLTPHLDRLAARGVKFAEAFTDVPLTFPAHVSIMTGLYPSRHGARDNGSFVLGPDALTLAERLHDAGYHTAAFVASYVLARSFGLNQGFDDYVDRVEVAGSRYAFSDLQRRGAEVAGDALAWVTRAAAADDRPIFLWMHLYDPHTPYEAPKAFADRFPGAPYNAEVAAADWAAGYLLDGLPPRVRDNALVIVTGDHGESLGEHGEPEHGIFLYDATLHVPLIIAGAGWPAGRTVTEQVRHIDLVPTVLDVLGLPHDADLPGVSLRPLAEGRDTRSGAGRGAPASDEPGSGAEPRLRLDAPLSYAESWFQRLHFGWSELRAVRSGDWKFIAAPHPELYDLKHDPGEAHNLIRERPAVASRLAGELDRIGRPSERALAAEHKMDAATVERLRSLGYLGGGGGTLSGGTGDDPKDRMADYVAFVGTFYAALADLEQGRAPDALSGFRDLARRFPESFEAHQYAGRALATLGRRREALSEYEVAIGLNPTFAAVYFDAARVEAALGSMDAARARLARGFAIEPESFYGYFVKGLVEDAAGDTSASRQAFERAVALNPGLAPAHLELGRLAEQSGDRTAALGHYRAALAADPGLRAAREAEARLRTPER
ncbi:MAG TPA: sulfatase-like hydrolase/transferase [Vicinamibacterales bacterium]|nr:sulfatase-like hydrolase/transferase [Vicinamibacterales bacterium]